MHPPDPSRAARRGPAAAGREPRPGWQIRVVSSTGSTNADLYAAALEGAPDRTVLAARYQTAGRGRMGRTWVAPAGASLLASILWRDPPRPIHLVTQRLAVAVCAVAAELAGLEARIKWPNDVLVGEQKLAGILAQADEDLSFVVAGVGVNVRWAPPEAARLGDFEPLDVLEALLAALDRQGLDVADAYRGLLATVDREVRIVQARRTWSAWAQGVDAEGRLVVRGDDGVTQALDAADVIHVRQGMM